LNQISSFLRYAEIPVFMPPVNHYSITLPAFVASKLQEEAEREKTKRSTLIAQIRVKLPGGLTKGKVTLKMTTGEKVINISNRGVVGAIKDDWAFLKAPPPKLANKLIVE
jgi:hypothetical protein